MILLHPFPRPLNPVSFPPSPKPHHTHNLSGTGSPSPGACQMGRAQS
jgi:hypothetical protein